MHVVANKHMHGLHWTGLAQFRAVEKCKSSPGAFVFPQKDRSSRLLQAVPANRCCCVVFAAPRTGVGVGRGER